MTPPFVVNFEGDSDIRFLQVSVELATRNPGVVDLVKHNRPAIRNNLVILFSDQDPQQLATRAGKNRLREEALAEVQQVVIDEGGPADIDSVYFTSFVMQ